MQVLNLKCVLVGDRTVGKTSLLLSYACNIVPGEYAPAYAEEGTVNLMIEKRPVILKLWDTTGHELYESFSMLSETLVFVMCFSIVSPQSYENIRKVWYTKISRHCLNALVLLVGTKLDLRDDEESIRELKEKNVDPLTYMHGVRMAEEIRAIKYLECSALTQEGVKEIFELACREGIKHSKKMRNKTTGLCKIL